MRTISTLLLIAAFGIAGCGDDDDGTAAQPQSGDAAEKKDAKAATITLGDSQFGKMLYDSNKQAIYIFENDRRNKTVCYGECADEWPPVFTEGAPQAANGVKEALLGTIERRDGRTQVTYAGKPLYFYAHEDPDTVLCHGVNKNGGLWWVVGADGNRRP